MYNILIVDDEPMICKGISSILRQSDIQIGELFTAGNGFEALDYFRLEKIDLIITDIQMEHMNGIELMETIFVENSAVPIIVLSAHGEFAYAQKAMKFGAKEYIVKPVMPKQLIQIVGGLLRHKESELRTASDAAFNRKFYLEETNPKQHMLLNELITEGLGESEVEALFQSLGLKMEGPCFCLFTIQLHLKNAGKTDKDIQSLRDRNLLKYACYNVVEETISSWDKLLFYSPNGALTVVLQLSAKELDHSMRSSLLTTIGQQLHAHLLEYLNVQCTIGISTIKEGLYSWAELYKEAISALKMTEVHHDHHVFLAEDVSDKKSTEDHNGDIQEARGYIDKHFSKKGMKLQDIADAVHLSPNYLSYLFKKVLNITIWDYLTKQRMEAGRRLLLTTDMRRYEIADEIGYESPEHFSKMFKKYFGYNLSDLKK
ncbi:response regulator [Paenibacillus sp. TAF43_2]|uniref:response regulator n=1 Tax=Paenibacillus sp. TAF43_2 TaxID=3233069 RepID=UPI003F9B2608